MPSGRILKPRSLSQYSNKLHGRGDSGIPAGDHIINTTLCRAQLVRPSMKDGPLVFRPWPALDYNDPSQLVPGRASVEMDDFSHFYVRVPMCTYVGVEGGEKASFVLYRPWEAQQQQANNPFRILFFAAHSAFKSGKFNNSSTQKWDAEWNPIMQGGKGRGAELSGPDDKYLFQAHVYMNGEKDYCSGERAIPLGLHQDDPLVIVSLSDSAGRALLSLLNTRKDGVDAGAVEDKPYQAFIFGDPTGIPQGGMVTGGLVLTAFHPSKTKIMGLFSSWDGNLRDVQGYEIALNNKYVNKKTQVYSSSMSAVETRRVLDTWQFWWAEGDQPGLINVPTSEEQCLYLAKAFAPIPRLIEFCWADRPEFMTAEVVAVLRARRSAVVPGMPDEGDSGPQQQEYFGPTGPTRLNTDPTQPTSASVFDATSVQSTDPITAGLDAAFAAAGIATSQPAIAGESAVDPFPDAFTPPGVLPVASAAKDNPFAAEQQPDADFRNEEAAAAAQQLTQEIASVRPVAQTIASARPAPTQATSAALTTAMKQTEQQMSASLQEARDRAARRSSVQASAPVPGKPGGSAPQTRGPRVAQPSRPV